MKKILITLCTLLVVGGSGQYMYAPPVGEVRVTERSTGAEPGRPGNVPVESGPSKGQISDISRPTTPIAQGTGGRLTSPPIKAKTVSLDPVSPVSDAVITTGPEGGYKSYADYQKEINLRDQPTDSTSTSALTTDFADSFNSTANTTGPNSAFVDYGDGSYDYPTKTAPKAPVLRLESPTGVADSSRPGSPDLFVSESGKGMTPDQRMTQDQRIGQIKADVAKRFNTSSDGTATSGTEYRSYTPRSARESARKVDTSLLETPFNVVR